MNTLKEAALNAGSVTVKAVRNAITAIQNVLNAIGKSISKTTGAAKKELVELRGGLEKSFGEMKKSLGNKFNDVQTAVSEKVDQVGGAVKSKLEAGADKALKNRIEGYREMVSSAKGNPSSIDNINRLIGNLEKAQNSPSVLERLNMTSQDID